MTEDTDRDPGRQAAAPRPAWVDGQDGDAPGRPRRERLPRQPVPGRQEDDGLWEHAGWTGLAVALGTFLAAACLPRSWPLWQLSLLGAVATAVIWWVSLVHTASVPVALYLASWGAVMTGWFTAARLAGPWHELVIFALVLPAAVLIPAGVTVIRRHRDRVKRVTETGRDNANLRECRYWEDLLQRLDVPGVTIRDVIRVDGGKQVHGRLDKAGNGRKVAATPDADAARRICVHLRLPKGSVYVEDELPGGTAADFIIHVRTVTGPRLARYLPAENSLLSINSKFALGVLDTGKEWKLRLREVRVFISGIVGSGKSTLLNVLIAQLCRMPDALIFMIDLKGGQEARAWLMPYLLGWTDRPAIDWLATTKEEADVMLDALMEGGKARAESGKYGRKLRPGIQKDGTMAPSVIVICDEQAEVTGHFIREGNISSASLATKLLRISERFRSVAIDPVAAAVRAVVDVTGNSGIKAMSDVTIGMRVRTFEEARQVFPDNIAAARQLALLKDKGVGIPKVGADLYPPVHFYNITDGEPDDDGNPTEDRITPIVLATADRRPAPEPLLRDAMGEAYAKRWQQPHMKELAEKWCQEAREAGASAVPPALPAPRPAPAARGGDDGDAFRDEFRDLVSSDPLLSELDTELDGDGTRPGPGLHPARKRMRQLLIARGRTGYTSGQLWNQLLSEGHEVARETVCRWLDKDKKSGYVYQTGKPRSRWVWRLPEGAEFEIPGWD